MKSKISKHIKDIIMNNKVTCMKMCKVIKYVMKELYGNKIIREYKKLTDRNIYDMHTPSGELFPLFEEYRKSVDALCVIYDLKIKWLEKWKKEMSIKHNIKLEQK